MVYAHNFRVLGGAPARLTCTNPSSTGANRTVTENLVTLARSRSPKLRVVDNVKALATKGRHAQSANFSLPRLEETTDDPSFAELMWWLAMVALNRAWELHDQLRAVAKINTQVVEEGKREEQAEEEAVKEEEEDNVEEAVKENVVEENAVAEEEE